MLTNDSAGVSVIIPAHNAAGTMSETLESLLAQTSDPWEAIVVDDGSSDETVVVASAYANRDARIRYVRRERSGVSAARNAGVTLARFDWLLFLDADDWLLPSYLERMIGVLESGIGVDAVFCGAARVTPDGIRVREDYRDESVDMFETFACRRVYPIHACVVRKSIVESVGGFDTSLRTCEDWDLWQRIARTGARFFGVSQELLALYRMRPTSASMDALQMLQDGLRVIARGHSADPRVSNPEPTHKDGLPETYLANTRLGLACWCAGLRLGRAEDARHLLALLEDDRDLHADPDAVAWSISRGALISAGVAPEGWEDLWPRIEGRVEELLLALEAQTKTPGLTRRIRLALEEGTYRAVACRFPVTHTLGVDISEPIPDVFAPARAERLQCLVKAEEKYIGRLDLPICDGLVPGYVIADAIAAEFAWQILGHFFERTLYGTLTVKREKAGLSLWRGSLRLTEALPIDERSLHEQAHDRVGWIIFLQEIWGYADWPASRFYHGRTIRGSGLRQSVKGEWTTIEVSDKVPKLKVAAEEIQTVFTIGGVAIGQVTVPVTRGRVSAHELRAALTIASGFELCRAVVREALLGRSFAEPLSLRARLASARNVRRAKSRSALGTIKDVSFAPGSTPAFDLAKLASERLLILERRANEAMGTSASRRAVLPAAAFEDLLDSAELSHDPVIETYRQGERPGRVMYAPELIHRSSPEGHEGRPLARGTDEPADDGLVTAHANQVVDEPDKPGFDWGHPFGAKVISKTLSATRGLRLLKEIRTPLYRIQLFRRERSRHFGLLRRKPEIIEAKYHAPLPPEIASQVRWDGDHSIVSGTVQKVVTARLPILMYHSVSANGPSGLARYRVTPAVFEEQLRYLRDTGFRSVTLEEWRLAMEAKRPLPGRAVIITFDDGYRDFLTEAWPLLAKHGFSATVFLVAECVGRTNEWDQYYGQEKPLLGWEEIRKLQRVGIEFGSHSLSHLPLTELPIEEVVREAARSRTILGQGLEVRIRAFAYPYGASDDVIHQLVGACGYTFGLTCRSRPSQFHDSHLALPRIEVTGHDGLHEFAAKVGMIG